MAQSSHYLPRHGSRCRRHRRYYVLALFVALACFFGGRYTASFTQQGVATTSQASMLQELRQQIDNLTDNSAQGKATAKASDVSYTAATSHATKGETQKRTMLCIRAVALYNDIVSSLDAKGKAALQDQRLPASMTAAQTCTPYAP